MKKNIRSEKIRHQTSDIRHQTSDIRHQTSDIIHQTSLNQKLSTISPLPASKSFTQFRNTLTHKGFVFRQGIIV